jgi:hypothetical protein
MGSDLTELRFEQRTFGSDIMLNYQLSQKLKLLGRSKFNHLIITLMVTIKLQLILLTIQSDMIQSIIQTQKAYNRQSSGLK